MRHEPDPIELGSIVELPSGSSAAPVVAWVVGTCWHHDQAHIDVRRCLDSTGERFSREVEWNIPASKARVIATTPALWRGMLLLRNLRQRHAQATEDTLARPLALDQHAALRVVSGGRPE